MDHVIHWNLNTSHVLLHFLDVVTNAQPLYWYGRDSGVFHNFHCHHTNHMCETDHRRSVLSEGMPADVTVVSLYKQQNPVTSADGHSLLYFII